MDFGTSTQAKSWMFDEDSLRICKERAAVIQGPCGKASPPKRVRSFACGFSQRGVDESLHQTHSSNCYTQTCDGAMDSKDQDTLVHFHAHQIQRLVGPNAIFPELRRSASVLSTAIMLFRRFYLSNSVVDFHPRDIAAASALLAVKVDCEKRLEVSEILSNICVFLICWRIRIFIHEDCIEVFPLIGSLISKSGL